MDYDVVVIGAGPAGIAAAIQLKRNGKRIVFIESHLIGGLLHHAHCIENYPGIPQGISGSSFARLLQIHINQLQIEVISARALGLVDDGRTVHITTTRGDFTARYVILATGTKAKELTDFELPPEAEKYIFYDPLRLEALPGSIAILGGGDAAFDYALRLHKGRQITVLSRSAPRALPLLVSRVRALPEIQTTDNFCPKEITVQGGKVQLVGEAETYTADHVLIAIGREAERQVVADNEDYWLDHPRCHWVGDVKNYQYRQAVIAAGDGLLTAMKIIELLKENH